VTAAAFLLAGGAILLWSSLALIGSRLAHLPPILMTGIALTIGGMLGLARLKEWRVPLPTLLLGVGGIFGYHVMLFTAFQISPIVEANLINYLWPLLIVLLTPAVLPGVGLKPRHVLAAVMGLAGAALIATGGSIHPDLAALPGYLLAAAAALTWALYSLLTKRVPPFGSGAVGAFCLAAGLLSLGVFFVQAGSSGFAAVRGSDWPFLLALGIGPMGAAFFLWDAALKRGDTRIIGSLSYVTPLLSTLALTLIGGRPMSLLSGIAMGLIVAGAAAGSLGQSGSILKKRAVTRQHWR
jgi:drug/metabolite transporter (DMT)-like permease